MNEPHIISDFCIGSDGEVASVCLFSEVPMEKIETVLLDYQSRTSVALLKTLIKNFWKLTVAFKETSGNYQSQIAGTTAGLVIGDRALQQRRISPFIYDLGSEWKKFTGLPFVFAAWISNKTLDDHFIKEFNNANSFGLSKLDDVVREHPYIIFDLHHYYNDCISFDLDENKRKGLELFLKMIKNN
jgi:chorismate dehydratase